MQTTPKLVAIDAASIETTRGGGQYGYLAMLSKSACYNLTVGNFIPLTNPGPNAITEGGITLAEIAV